MLGGRHTHGEALWARRPQPQPTARPPPSPSDPPGAQRPKAGQLHGSLCFGQSTAHPAPDPIRLPQAPPFHVLSSLHSCGSDQWPEPLECPFVCQNGPNPDRSPIPSCPPYTPARTQGGQYLALSGLVGTVSPPHLTLTHTAASMLLCPTPSSSMGQSSKGHTLLTPEQSWTWSHLPSLGPAPMSWGPGWGLAP